MNRIGPILRLALAESFKSLRASKVRSGLTVALIAIGLMSLVGVLTAIDAIQASVSDNLAKVGGASFDIHDVGSNKRRRGWLQDSPKRPMYYGDVSLFKRLYSHPKQVTLWVSAAWGGTATANGKKTNPNTWVVGGDENYLNAYAYELTEGRNFTNREIQQARASAIIGPEIKKLLFPTSSAIGQRFVVLNRAYTIIGVLKDMGGVMGNNSGQRMVLLPLNTARVYQKIGGGYTLRITTKTEDLSNAQIEATRLMGVIRGDRPGHTHSFEVERNESAISSINEIGNSLRIGGAVIGFITLLGASIGLLNIMIVSVRERTREIGIRKSLGATTDAIRIQFLAEAIVICLLGAIVGVALGVGIGNIIPIVTGAGGFVFPVLWIFVGLVTSIVVGVASGLYPANTAAKVDPVESLRYE